MIKFSILILSLAIVGIATNTEKVPDLMVNQEAYDCSNAQMLLIRAKQDQLTLEGISNRIAEYSAKILEARDIVGQICNSQNQPMFLQTIRSNKNDVKLPDSIAKVLKNKPSPAAHPVALTLHGKFEDALSELTTLSNLEGKGITDCDGTNKKIDDTLDYLGKVFQEINNNWLNGYLPVRVTEIQSYLTKCKDDGVLTQTGIFVQTYWNTGHIFEKKPEKERTETYPILFDDPFYDIPTVAVTLRDIDLDDEDAGVFVEATNIKTSGFDVVVTAPAGALVYGVRMSWLATIPSRSGINLHTISINTENNKDLKEISNGKGERVITYDLQYPKPLKNPGIAAAISGFQFGHEKNLRIDVHPINITNTGYTLVIKTWADTIFKAVDLNLLTFEKTEDQGSANMPSQVTGTMYGGPPSARDDIPKIPFSAKNPQFWMGFADLDFIHGYNYRVNSDVNVENNMLKLHYSTWWDTQIWQVENVVFWTPLRLKQIITESGTFKKVYWATGHVFEQESNEERVESYDIYYENEFDETPSVAVALNGLDICHKNPGLKFYAEKITTKGFVLTVVAPATSKLYMIEVAWLATISSKSGIYVSTISRDSESDRELKKISHEQGERLLTSTIKNPVHLKNPAVVIGMSGFKFGTEANIRLDLFLKAISEDDTTIGIKTWADTIFYAVDITVLHYERESNQDSTEINTITKGAMYHGSGGNRMEKFKVPLGIENPALWIVLKHIDFIHEHNYRLNQDVTVGEERIDIVLSTWADTQVWRVTDSIFYTSKSKSTFI